MQKLHTHFLLDTHASQVNSLTDSGLHFSLIYIKQYLNPNITILNNKKRNVYKCM